MSLKTVHLNEIIQLGTRKFRVPVLIAGKKSKKKDENTDLAEELIQKNQVKFEEKDEESMYDDSSSDDELFDYWINDKKEEEENQMEEIKAPTIAKPEKVEIETGEQTQAKKQFTHFLHFPLYEADKFSRRCSTFKRDLGRQFPALERYAIDLQRLSMTIVPLTLSGFQVDILSQVVQNIQQIHIDCSNNKKKKIKLDLQGIQYFAEGNTKDARNTTKVCANITKDQEFVKLEAVVSSLVGKLIEIGVVQDHELEGVRFDLSALQYKMESPHITLMETKDKSFNAVQIVESFSNFNFGHAEIKTVVLSKMDTAFTVVAKGQF